MVPIIENEEMTEMEYDSLITIPGLGVKGRENLRRCGFNSIDSIRQAEAEDLAKVPGIGNQKAVFVKEYLE